ncbi:MAG TPA: hypothetical protein VGC42_03775 [Kofleriaceae bacterium]
MSEPPAMRPAWLVGMYAGLITFAVGAGIALLVAVATGAIHRNPAWAGAQFGRAYAPFVVIVWIAGWAIQRARIKSQASPAS